MALEQRLETLRKRHSNFDMELRAEEGRPFPDAAKVQQLKYQKLSLKDEIARLTSGSKYREAA